MIKIENIQIKRYRSINDLTLSIDESYNITTICGQNNVGKTNVLRAISLFFNKTQFIFKEDVPEFKDLNPTAEHIAYIIWNKLRVLIDADKELEITLYETPRNFVTYKGN